MHKSIKGRSCNQTLPAPYRATIVKSFNGGVYIISVCKVLRHSTYLIFSWFGLCRKSSRPNYKKSSSSKQGSFIGWKVWSGDETIKGFYSNSFTNLSHLFGILPFTTLSEFVKTLGFIVIWHNKHGSFRVQQNASLSHTVVLVAGWTVLGLHWHTTQKLAVFHSSSSWVPTSY